MFLSRAAIIHPFFDRRFFPVWCTTTSRKVLFKWLNALTLHFSVTWKMFVCDIRISTLAMRMLHQSRRFQAMFIISFFIYVIFTFTKCYPAVWYNILCHSIAKKIRIEHWSPLTEAPPWAPALSHYIIHQLSTWHKPAIFLYLVFLYIVS